MRRLALHSPIYRGVPAGNGKRDAAVLASVNWLQAMTLTAWPRTLATESSRRCLSQLAIVLEPRACFAEGFDAPRNVRRSLVDEALRTPVNVESPV